jgi:ribosomal protein S12 methylthiotransferase accessory factor
VTGTGHRSGFGRGRYDLDDPIDWAGRLSRPVTAKLYRDGTHRTVRPGETVARVRPFLPIIGATRIANVTGLDRIGIPVVMVCRPNSRSIAVAQGKGLDLDAAIASGVMESMEGYHAEHITRPLKLNSLEDLRYTHRMIEVERLPTIEGSRFHSRLPTLWIEGYDLLQDDFAWLPHELVHMDCTIPAPPGSGCFPSTSTGLASGNHPLEAVSHALCETIERDALTLWLLGPVAHRRASEVDLDSVDDAACRSVVEKLHAARFAVAVWDITSTLGVPAFLCRISDRDVASNCAAATVDGSGCHPSRTVAFLRAVTEAVQSRLTQISGTRDDMGRNLYGFDMAAERTGPRVDVAPAWRGRAFRDVPSREHETFEEDVNWLLDRMRGAGLEHAIVVDLTRPEFGLPILRVIVPGLEDGVETPGYEPGPRARETLEAWA